MRLQRPGKWSKCFLSLVLLLAFAGAGMAPSEIEAPPMEPPELPEAAAPKEPAAPLPSAPEPTTTAVAPSAESTLAPVEEPKAAEPSGEKEAPLTLPPAEAPKAENHPSGSQDEQAILDSPTRSVEDYERVRLEHLHETSLPDYGVSLTIEPKAFGKVDLRAPAHKVTDQANPSLFGFKLGYDHTLYKHAGISMLGIDGGFYGSTQGDPFANLMFGFLSIEPHAQ
ncbi:MAG: hypothetical protein HY075_07130, partial [Deltaproteobacteria bacterium]|nr:hypothetical protein [Deltaproteobacteria bacterium]